MVNDSLLDGCLFRDLVAACVHVGDKKKPVVGRRHRGIPTVEKNDTSNKGVKFIHKSVKCDQCSSANLAKQNKSMEK